MKIRTIAKPHVWMTILLIHCLSTTMLPGAEWGRSRPATWRHNAPCAISITFDDSGTSRAEGGAILGEFGLKATFNINAGDIWPAVQTISQNLANDGHELGIQKRIP